MRGLLLAITATAALVSPARAQTEFLVDFGDVALQTAAQSPTWNNLHKQNSSQLVPLVDSDGNATAVSAFFTFPLGRSELTGVQVPAAGSELEQLAWPLSAISDSLLSDSISAVPEGELRISGLDLTATYDLKILGSVLGSGVSLTVEYTTFGADTVSVIGETAENTSELLHLRGIRPAADATIALRIRNATTNTSPERRFYINALSLLEHPAGTQPALLGFNANRLDVSRLNEKGPVTASLGLYTSTGATSACLLEAVDASTGSFPTWLTVPQVAQVGTDFLVHLDPGGLPPGTYTALLRALSGGFVPYGTLVEFTVRPPGRLNLLYYGNSYTAVNGSVNALVDRLAEEAGLVVPASVPRTFAGKNLAYHLNTNQVEAISRSLPLGEEWDHVILQGGTVEAAATAGNPTKFVTDGLSIMANVRAHSPQAGAVIYQTWARGAGHSFYQGAAPKYPGPLDMHLELEEGNEQLAAAINATYSLGTAVVAGAGESAALRGFDPVIYQQDLSHPGLQLTAQAGLTIFSAIYGLAACNLAVDFDTPGPLAAHLAAIGFDEDDWSLVAGIGDRAGAPGLRKYPGSDEDFLLMSGPLGGLTPCNVRFCPAGTKLRFELDSPAGSLLGFPVLIYVDQVGLSGGTTMVPPWPEAYYSPSALVQVSTTQLGPAGLATEVILQLELVGHTLLVQGLTDVPSANTGHAFTLSDAHAVHVLPPPPLSGTKLPH